MSRAIVTDRAGGVRQITAADGASLMEAMRDGGVDDIMALCGGVCSCATCHVFVDPSWLGTVGDASEEEIELLRGSSHYRPTSRLSCQIVMSLALDGIRVSVAPPA
jgi:2Fe-2S ferredoxin